MRMQINIRFRACTIAIAIYLLSNQIPIAIDIYVYNLKVEQKFLIIYNINFFLAFGIRKFEIKFAVHVYGHGQQIKLQTSQKNVIYIYIINVNRYQKLDPVY
jgi:hypothetical protein